MSPVFLNIFLFLKWKGSMWKLNWGFFPTKLSRNIQRQIPPPAYCPAQSLVQLDGLSGMKWSEWSKGSSSFYRLVWDHPGAVIPFPALSTALFEIPGESLPLLCPLQSDVNLGEYFSGASWHLGEKNLHTFLWATMGCTGFQEPILFAGGRGCSF